VLEAGLEEIHKHMPEDARAELRFISADMLSAGESGEVA